MESPFRTSGSHRFLLVGSQEACKERRYLDRAVSAGGGSRQARRHTSIQTRVRNVVHHPKITSKGDYSVVSHTTVLTTFMFPLFHTFHLVIVCHPVPSKAKCCMGRQAGLTRAGAPERGGQPPRAEWMSVALTLCTWHRYWPCLRSVTVFPSFTQRI